MPGSSDLLIVARRVLTMAGESNADAVLVRDGRIAAVGLGHELRSLAAAGAETLELEGATLLPGVNDSHAHVANWGSTRPPLALDVTPRAVRSIAEIRDTVAAAPRSTPPGTWIRGNGWHPAAL